MQNTKIKGIMYYRNIHLSSRSDLSGQSHEVEINFTPVLFVNYTDDSKLSSSTTSRNLFYGWLIMYSL